MQKNTGIRVIYSDVIDSVIAIRLRSLVWISLNTYLQSHPQSIGGAKKQNVPEKQANNITHVLLSIQINSNLNQFQPVSPVSFFQNGWNSSLGDAGSIWIPFRSRKPPIPIGMGSEFEFSPNQSSCQFEFSRIGSNWQKYFGLLTVWSSTLDSNLIDIYSNRSSGMFFNMVS